MNKKGLSFFWILLIMLVALGTFLIIYGNIEIPIYAKGDWSLNFIKNNYLPAERELLRIDQAAIFVGQQTAVELAAHGGFTTVQNPPCGKLGEITIWNKDCFPGVTQNALSLAQDKLKTKLADHAYSEIGFRGTTFYGKDGFSEIKADNNAYKYKADFEVNLSYSLDEWNKLLQDANAMLNRCSNTKDLKTCVNGIRPAYWKYQSCSSDEFPKDTRVINFCVESPNHYKLSIGTESVPVSWPVEYSIALDFTPTGPLQAEELSGAFSTENSMFELHLQRDPYAEKYIVYYSDYVVLEDRKGTYLETFGNVPTSGFFLEKKEFRAIDLDLDAVACTSGGIKEPDKGYLCGNEVILTISDARFKLNEDYVFGVTSYSDSKESDFGTIVKLKNG